jgi:hypothetical protein
MDRFKLARRYMLVLDPSDKVAAVLIAAIEMYLAIKEAEPLSAPEAQYGSKCPYCDRLFAGVSDKGARMALNAHVRQIHHQEWLAEWKKD